MNRSDLLRSTQFAIVILSRFPTSILQIWDLFAGVKKYVERATTSEQEITSTMSSRVLTAKVFSKESSENFAAHVSSVHASKASTWHHDNGCPLNVLQEILGSVLLATLVLVLRFEWTLPKSLGNVERK